MMRGGGGGGGSKNKNRAGETERKKIRARKSLKKSLKKNSCRDFSIGKIISSVRVAPNLENKTFFDI